MISNESKAENIQKCARLRRDWIRNNLHRFTVDDKSKHYVKELEEELKELNRILSL